MTSHTVEALDNPRVRVTAQLGPGGPELEHRCDRGQLSGTAPLHASRMRVLELASFRAPHLQLARACGCHCTPRPPRLSVQIPQTAPSEGLSRLFFNQASDSDAADTPQVQPDSTAWPLPAFHYLAAGRVVSARSVRTSCFLGILHAARITVAMRTVRSHFSDHLPLDSPKERSEEGEYFCFRGCGVGEGWPRGQGCGGGRCETGRGRARQ